MDNVGFADLKKSLECPICLEMLVTPVVNCTLGHIICSLCRPKVDKCGLCGSRFMNGSRNYPIETILGMMEVSCRHTGCPLVMKADKLNEHLSVCDFRPIPCHEPGVVQCTGQLINFEDYPKHLVQVHEDPSKTTTEPAFQRIHLCNALGETWPILLIKYGNQTFFLHRRAISKYQLSCWVSMMGSEREAANYMFRIRIQDPYEPMRYMEWSVSANSVHTSLDSIKEAGNCVFIPVDALAPYCERKVKDAVGKIFEYQWIMKIFIETEVPSSAYLYFYSAIMLGSILMVALLSMRFADFL